MNPTQIISSKRDGKVLSESEIRFFVRGFTDGSIPDYQMAALAMAIYLNDMTSGETAVLTREMLDSGKTLAWPTDAIPMVDKHSTGGIGDKVSLVLAPLLACCGVQVPMISGRGLGPTGGTLDKLESIPGFRTDLSLREMQAVADQVGCVINSASAELAPADRKLYALRDVTGTVPSIPLITASIMSKKLAEGLDALVLDVKCGSGAFMKTLDRAKALAKSLVRTGKDMNVKVSAMLTDMSQPLGRMVGNAVEVDESVSALQGEGPDDLIECTLALCGESLRLAGKVTSRAAGEAQIQVAIDSGAGLQKFREMVEAQGGDLDAPRPVASSTAINSQSSGFVIAIDTEAIGMAVIELGGGRKVKSDEIDHAVGLEMLVRLGDGVTVGQPLANLFARAGQVELAQSMIHGAISVAAEPVSSPPLILESVD